MQGQTVGSPLSLWGGIKTVSYGTVEKVRSSLLKKLFSTILKLTPLQIRNSRSAQRAEFAAVLFVKNGARKNLQLALGTPFSGFFNRPAGPILPLEYYKLDDIN